MTTLYVDNIAPNLQSRVSVPGHVIQVVSTETNAITAYAVGGGSWSSDILTLDITPTSATSKILITASMCVGTEYYNVSFRVLKDGSTIPTMLGASNGSNARATFAVNMYSLDATQDDHIGTASYTGLDTAGTTNTITYSIQGGGRVSGDNWRLNCAWDNNTGTGNRSVGISSLTAMEIAG